MSSFGLFAVVDATQFELTYQLPEGDIAPGSAWYLPLQGRVTVGVFLSRCPEPSFPCRTPVGPVPWTRPFSPILIDLVRWCASYYIVSLPRAMRSLAPGFFWDHRAARLRDKRFSKWLQVCSDGSIAIRGVLPTSIRGEMTHGVRASTLRPEQNEALRTIVDGADLRPLLLHGVTGSGKTEVYLAAAETVLAEGKRVLMLVPEISLTPQMTSRFRQVFGESLAVMHSMLTPLEYEREWFRIHLGLARVVLGVRTAVFAPLTDIGLIIVDEEHDGSYKTDDNPSYNARDVAVVRAVKERARCVLGSATPSLESWANVTTGKYRYASLSARHSGFLPKVEIVDARKFLSLANPQGARRVPGKSSLIRFGAHVLAPPVLTALRETRERGEQSMVILNRRGYASYALCSGCGAALLCPHCSVSTTLHARCAQERCHYCGFETPTRTSCPECGGREIVAMGAGTQNLEAEIVAAIPELRVGRLDRDVLTSQTRLAEILTDFRSGRLDCLVGTQLLAKGHDFPRVSLIGIVHLEDGLFLPDFRAAERTFQLLTQSAGRAGRGEVPGSVIIQSLVPGHPVVSFALEARVRDFLERELEQRRLGWHPPFSRQILIECQGASLDVAMAIGNEVRELLVEHWKAAGLSKKEVRLVGPQPAVLERLRNISRVQICITAHRSHLPQRLVPAQAFFDAKWARKVRVDVDPQSFL